MGRLKPQQTTYIHMIGFTLNSCSIAPCLFCCDGYITLNTGCIYFSTTLVTVLITQLKLPGSFKRLTKTRQLNFLDQFNFYSSIFQHGQFILQLTQTPFFGGKVTTVINLHRDINVIITEKTDEQTRPLILLTIS